MSYNPLLFWIIFLISLLILSSIFDLKSEKILNQNLEIDNKLNSYINYNYEHIGIITIATGGYDATDLVKSIRVNGKWINNVYVYTDTCTSSPNNTIIIESPNVRRSLDSKILKTQILKDTVEKYILYLDS